MIVFSTFIQSGYKGTRHHFSIKLVSFSVLENKQVRRSFFQCSICNIITLLLTKLVRSRWPDIDFVSVHKSAKRELGQYPAILTSRLVNNIYLFLFLFCFCVVLLCLFQCLIKHPLVFHLGNEN